MSGLQSPSNKGVKDHVSCVLPRMKNQLINHAWALMAKTSVVRSTRARVDRTGSTTEETLVDTRNNPRELDVTTVRLMSREVVLPLFLDGSRTKCTTIPFLPSLSFFPPQPACH